MKRLFIFSLLVLGMFPFVPAKAITIAPGMLIKASGPAIYYFTDKNTRLVFPNEKVYFSWYENFNGVIEVPDLQLSSIPLGGNVTLRPGKYLIKLTTDPRVYAIDKDGSLRWIKTEQIAKDLYGANWAKLVQDIPDAYFADYGTGSSIASATDYNPNGVMASCSTILTELNGCR